MSPWRLAIGLLLSAKALAVPATPFALYPTLELTLQKPVPPTSRLAVVISTPGDRPLLTAWLRRRLLRDGLSFTIVTNPLDSRHLPAPKLVVEISGTTARIGYFRAVTHDNVHYRFDLVWQREESLGAGDEEIVFRSLSLALSDFVGRYGTPHALRGKQRAASEPSETQMEWQWSDPDPKHNRIFVGASAGTPAYGNLHLGYWGSASLPLVFGLSGMAFDSTHRGVQADLAYALDDRGDTRQLVGLALVLPNQTFTTSVTTKDAFGRNVATRTQVRDELRPYLGPVYALSWKDIRVQLGAGTKLRSDSASSVIFFVQVGYLPCLRF